MTTLNEFLRLSKINLCFNSSAPSRISKAAEYLNEEDSSQLRHILSKVNQFEISMDFCRFLFDSFEKKLKQIISRILKLHPNLNKKKTKFIFEIIDASYLIQNENIILLFEVYKQVEKLGNFGRMRMVKNLEFLNTKMVFDHYKLFI